MAKRQMAFIDARNMLNGVTKHYDDAVKIDFVDLVGMIGFGDLVGVYFYDSHPPNHGKGGWYTALKKNGFDVTTKTLRYREDGEQEAVGIDIGISTEMVGRAHMDEYDEALLYTADTDFRPAIAHVQEHAGKDVTVVQFDVMMQERMVQTADRFISLDDFDEDLVREKM